MTSRGMTDAAALGRQGETLAANYLEEQGYRVLERNYRFEGSEVDIVCFKPDSRYELGGEIVFVEVKTRSDTGFGHPEEAVDEQKQRHIIKASRAYLYESKLERSPCRFDVIGIVVSDSSAPVIEHFEHAFWAP
ncbi:MAG: YraN family protein [Rhodothermia bacterium]|nr:YraN family protein [Rhodothermia bacterium]